MAGEAIAGNLLDSQPEPFEAARQVFLRVRAPHCGVTSGGVAQAVFSASRRTGIGLVYAHRRPAAVDDERRLVEGQPGDREPAPGGLQGQRGAGGFPEHARRAAGRGDHRRLVLDLPLDRLRGVSPLSPRPRRRS